MDEPQVLAPVETGLFPALRKKLRLSLDEIYMDTEESVDELIRVAKAEQDIVDSMLKKAKQSLRNTQDYAVKNTGNE